MALSDNLKNSADEIQRLNDLGTEFSAIYGDIGKALNNLAKESVDFSTGIEKAKNTSEALSKSAQELAGFTKEDLKDRKKINAFAKKSQNLAKNRAKLQSQIRVFQAQSVNATKDEQDILEKVNRNLLNSLDSTKDITDAFNDVLDTSKKIEKSNPFKGVGDLVSEIPVLNKFFPEFQKASKTFRDNMAEGEGFLKSSAKSTQQLSGFFNKLTIGLVVKAFNDVDSRVTSLSRNLNRSNQEAIDLTQSANKVAKSIAGVTGRDITQAQNDFGSALKVTTPLSNEIAANFSTLQTKLGLSVDEAAEFTKLNEALGKNSKEQTDTLIGQIELQNAQNNTSLRYQDIIKGVASTSKATLLSIEGQGKSIANVVYQASRLGLTLNQIDSTASSLLNFETSIASEMEAELLLGRQLNLDKARQATLNNDLETVTREIAKNIGTAAEFSKLNRIQQEALAGAVGMSREDLASSLIEQEAITKLGAKDVNEARAKVKERLREINAIQDLTKREEARAAFARKIGSEEYLRQQENRSLTELQTELAQKLLETFDKVAHALSPLKGTFKFLIDNIEGVAIGLTAIAGIGLVSKFGRLLKIFKGISGFTKSIGKFMGKSSSFKMPKMPKIPGGAGKPLLKTLGKGLGKGASKLLPGVGLAFAAEAFSRGDITSGLLNTGAGIASFFPGVGTAVAGGLTAIDVGRDIYKATQEPPAEDFIMRPGQGVQKFRKDDIVIGGTNLLGGDNNGNNEVISLLKELIHTVKSGGDIYMDGNKVGKSLAMATSNFS